MKELIAQLQRLERRVQQLEMNEQAPTLGRSTANVSNPPTDAELDSAFGTAANLPAGYCGIVDDAGAGTAVWLCYVTNSAWFYEALTKAV